MKENVRENQVGIIMIESSGTTSDRKELNMVRWPVKGAACWDWKFSCRGKLRRHARLISAKKATPPNDIIILSLTIA